MLRPNTCGFLPYVTKNQSITISLLQNRFYTYPGDVNSRTNAISRLKTDQCDPAGCLFELSSMLLAYMVFRQIANNCLEFYFP